MRTDSHNRHRRWLPTLLTAAFVLTVCTVCPALAETLPYMEGQVVLKLSRNADISDEMIDILDSAKVGSMNSSPIYLLQFDDTVNTVNMARQLQYMKGVLYAHPNFKMDSLHPGQGSNPFGDDEGRGKWKDQEAVESLYLPGAHQMSTGEQIKVGIIDSGIEFLHPVFDPPQTPFGWDYVDDDAEPFDEPGGSVSGHGTFVAGLVHLVAPDAILYAYRIVDTSGSGNGFDLGRAIEQAVDDGCDVINISLVLTGRHLPVRDAIAYARRHHVAIVAAAGNEGCYSYTCKYPAEELDAVAVGACDASSDPVLASFSSFGSTVQFCAPGEDVYSAYIGGTYTWWNGTSFSTPFLTGQLALMKEIWPKGTPAELLSICAETAVEDGVVVRCMIPWIWPGDRLINSYQACIKTEIAATTGGDKPGQGKHGPATSLNEFHPATDVGDDSCWVEPASLFFTAEAGSTDLIYDEVQVFSTNAPAPFDMTVLGGASSFVSVPLFFVAPETNTSMEIIADPSGLSEGIYTDTVVFSMHDIDCNTMLEVELQVTEAEPPRSRLRNHPNPFNPSTTVSFGLKTATHVNLTVYDIIGREVVCLVDRRLAAGDHEVVWDGKDGRGQQVGSGVYLYRLKMGHQVETRKMTLIK